MEKRRNFKILSIVALVLAITGMALGFAAFSTTLNISSKATVTPNAEDFSFQVLGIDSLTPENMYDSSAYTSLSSSSPLISRDHADNWPLPIGGNAIIDGLSINISDVYLYTYGDILTYGFVIRNTGKYDTYLYPGSVGEKQCIVPAGSEISISDAERVCSDVNGGILAKRYKNVNGSEELVDIEELPFKLGVSEEAFLFIEIEYGKYGETFHPYDDVRIDFGEIKLVATTNPN